MSSFLSALRFSSHPFLCSIRSSEMAEDQGDREPLIGTPSNTFYNSAHTPVVGFSGRQRTLSSHNLDPYEDPVVGLGRYQPVRRRVVIQGGDSSDEEGQRLRRRKEAAERDAALSSKFESLNYEVCENSLYRAAEESKDHQVKLFRLARNRWLACFLIGVTTALVGVCIDILVHYSAEVKFGLILNKLASRCTEEAATGNQCMWMVQAAWMAYNCGLVLIAASLVVFWAPVAAGSGIPQVKCYLNGIAIPEVVRLKTLLAKSIGVSCAVGGGLCAGKEGPMIHSGAVIGAGMSQGKCSSLGCDTGLFKEFRNDVEKRDFVAAGAAAGVAAAFGAPIGGVLFSLEEGASFWNQALTWRMFFSAMISSFTLNVLLSIFYGKGGWLSWTGLANFGVFENKNYNLWEIPFFLGIGVIGGCLGALFNTINFRIAHFRKKYISNRWQRLVEALLVAAVSAFIGFATLFIVDDCVKIGINANRTDGLNQLYCKRGEYSAVANLYFNNPEESVKNLFHSPINSFQPTTLAIFAAEYFILSAWTFGLSVPSGVFIPCLLTGAAWGRLVGIGVEHLFPNITGIDPGKYALMGAAAQLGGVVRMTISLTAIIIEATKDITFGLPIMLVLMITKWVGDIFNEGIYDMCIELAEVPILGWHPPKMARNIKASSVMRSDVMAVERRERVGRILELLSSTSHHAFPVVDRIDESDVTRLPDYGRLEGIILRSQVVTLLRKRAFVSEWEEERIGGAATATLDDFMEQDDKEDLNTLRKYLSDEDEAAWLDLTPYMHPHPHRVPLHASLPFVYRIFRGLGLRYILVVNEDNRLRGIITRKDVARYRNKGKGYTLSEMYIAD